MAKIKARDVVVFFGNTAIAYQRECNIEIDCDIEEKSSASSYAWKQFFTKRKSWKMSLSALLPASENDPASYVGATVTAAFCLSETPDGGIDAADRTKDMSIASGSAIITSVKCGAPKNGHVSFSLDLVGTGELS